MMQEGKQRIEVDRSSLEQMFVRCKNKEIETILREIAEQALTSLRTIQTHQSLVDGQHISSFEQQKFVASLAVCSRLLRGGVGEIDIFLNNRHKCTRARLSFRTVALQDKANRILVHFFGDQSKASYFDKCAGMLNLMKTSICFKSESRVWVSFFLESAIFFFWMACSSSKYEASGLVSTPNPPSHTPGELEAALALVELGSVLHVF